MKKGLFFVGGIALLSLATAGQCPDTRECRCGWTEGGRNCQHGAFVNHCHNVCCNCARQPQAVAASSCETSLGLQCKSPSQCIHGFHRGYCPGSSLCCKEEPVNFEPAKTACEETFGLQCKASHQCVHGFHRGYCPGSSLCCKAKSVTFEPIGGGGGWTLPKPDNQGGYNGNSGNSGSTSSRASVDALTGWSTGQTTRYWDCCKPSGAWPSNVGRAKGVVRTCARDGVTPVSPNAVNVCAGGGDRSHTAYMCLDHAPFYDGGQLYGFVAVLTGMCKCFELEFTSGPGKGKTMLVQATNTGDLSADKNHLHFDIQLPGGGFGQFNGCSTPRAANGPGQFDQGRYPRSVWGPEWNQNRGGVTSKSMCESLPPKMKEGCRIRFDVVGDNPSVKYRQIKCPRQLTERSGCSRDF